MAAPPDDSSADRRAAATDRRIVGAPVGGPPATTALVLVFERPEAGQELLATVLPYLRDETGHPVGFAVTDAGCLVLGGRGAPPADRPAAHAILLIATDPAGTTAARVRGRLPAGVTVIAEGEGTGLLDRYAGGADVVRGLAGDPGAAGDPELLGIAADARRAAVGLRPAAAGPPAARPAAAPAPAVAGRSHQRGHLIRLRGRDGADVARA